jgi:molybdenum cofactor cytidylyltransferase
MNTLMLGGLIPAAGSSARMGAFKPLLMAQEKALIVHTIGRMRSAGVGRIAVVLGHRRRDMAEVIRTYHSADQVVFAVNDAYAHTDMLASVKIGLRVLPPCDAFFLLPGDMPVVRPDTFRSLADRMADTGALLAFPSYHGQQGHPALISARLIEPILGYHSDGGLAQLWGRYVRETVVVPVEDAGCVIDADTMEDYAAMLEYMEEMRR